MNDVVVLPTVRVGVEVCEYLPVRDYGAIKEERYELIEALVG